MDAKYATMLGYTQQEFETNFREQIEAVEKKQDLCGLPGRNQKLV